MDHRLLLFQVSHAVAKILGSPVDHDAVLMAAGLDSLGSVELVAELEKLGKIDLPGEHCLDSESRVLCSTLLLLGIFWMQNPWVIVRALRTWRPHPCLARPDQHRKAPRCFPKYL